MNSTLEIQQRNILKDGNEKYLFKTSSGGSFEGTSLFVSELKPSRVFCISTQIGCNVGCIFCASSQTKFIRNLSAEEMLFEVDLMQSFQDYQALFRVAFMGIGEPFNNYDNLIGAMGLLRNRFKDSCRRYSVSTIGVPGAITRFALDTKNYDDVNLRLSLHFVNDKKSNIFMKGTMG